MLNKKTKNRLLIFFLFSLFVIIIAVLSFKTLEDNVLYFFLQQILKKTKHQF